MTKDFIDSIKKKIIEEDYKISFEQALDLFKAEDSKELFNAALEIRKKRCDNQSDICSIINAKQGGCSENCKYCAQSAHWKTSCKASTMIDSGSVISKCRTAVTHKVKRLSLVTAGKGLSGKEFSNILDIFSEAHSQCPQIKLCASLGIISYPQMLELKDAGVVRYHHNIETGKNFFSKICTTHTYDDRIKTLYAAKKAGLELCTGGIIGMGESTEDRLSLAFALKELEPHSIPINVLSPIKGTPLENAPPLSKDEILRTIAIFRFILPSSVLRIAAGRKALGKNGIEAFEAGANALISGDLLTIEGSTNKDDIEMLKELGFDL